MRAGRCNSLGHGRTLQPRHFPTSRCLSAELQRVWRRGGLDSWKGCAGGIEERSQGALCTNCTTAQSRIVEGFAGFAAELGERDWHDHLLRKSPIPSKYWTASSLGNSIVAPVAAGFEQRSMNTETTDRNKVRFARPLTS